MGAMIHKSQMVPGMVVRHRSAFGAVVVQVIGRNERYSTEHRMSDGVFLGLNMTWGVVISVSGSYLHNPSWRLHGTVMITSNDWEVLE